MSTSNTDCDPLRQLPGLGADRFSISGIDRQNLSTVRRLFPRASETRFFRHQYRPGHPGCLDISIYLPVATSRGQQG